MNNDQIEAAKQVLRHSQRVLLASHIRPDGDAIGSLLGLGLALQENGTKVQMVLADGVPRTFQHLIGSKQIKKKPKGEFDTVVTLDSSSMDRLGDVFQEIPTPDINIDHHVTNRGFARINIIDAKATATAEILVDLLPLFDLQISTPVANALLTGLITDTIGFRTTNMRPQALRKAAELIELGADLPGLYQKALLNRSYEAARYWGAGLNALQRDRGLIWTSLTLEDRKSTNYPGMDDADLVNILSSIEGADIALIFIEQSNGHVKVSWRARPGYDVAKVAAEFGGGGHKPASGATIEGSLSEIQTKVLEKTYKLLDGRK
jgi:phosphoesterase RecJ-like protein